MRFPVLAFLGGSLLLAVIVGCKKDAPALVSSGGKVTTTDVVVGKDPRVVQTGDTLWVQYRGTLKNGKVFDQNMSQDKDPLSFTVGEKGVIEGWEIGVVGMHPGGERTMHIPAKYAYAAEGNGPVPPNADLDFDVKLLGLSKSGEDNVVDHTEIKPGTGTRVVKPGDTVTIQYVGALLTGKVFKDSHPKAESFKVGNGDVLSCLDVGVKGMKVGGVRKIIAPPAVAFQAQATGGVPANSMVTFVVEMVAIK